MYADENGTPLDVVEEWYFRFDSQYFTCVVNDITVATVKSVFIGQLGNVYEFTCNFVDCADTVLVDFTNESFGGGQGELDYWDRAG